jgi:hypothetical protein
MNTLMNSPIARRIAPVFLLALGFALLIPAAACATPAGNENPESESTEAAQGDLVAMLPAEITTLGYIDFAAVRDTAAYDYLRNDTEIGDAGFEDIIAETGIDPRTDLHRIAFVSNSGFATWDDRAAFIVVATFDRARIEEAVAAAPTAEYSGRTLVQVSALARVDEEGAQGDSTGDAIALDGDIDGWMTLLSDTVIAFGSEASIRAIVDVADGAPSARDNADLMGLLEDVNTDSQFWLVSAQEGLFSGIDAGEGSPIGQIGYDRINAMIVALDLGDGLSFRMRGRTAAEEDAKNLGDALNGMVALGKMMLQSNNPAVFEILDRSIETGSRGRDVTINADLSIEDLEALRAYAESMLSADGAESVVGD